jgi:hypothetical protein
MNHLTLAYVNQADRERDIQDNLRRRQLLDAAANMTSPVETARSSMRPQPTPVRARATGR